ncbi:MAG: hypothetical protein DWI28_03670 [Planctomycetota bacterium]|nr:MAG: hypothetical protein DWI28_03670 [Planctomycetota bacterium]
MQFWKTTPCRFMAIMVSLTGHVFWRMGCVCPSKLCTEVAKTKEMIQWADGRASFRVVPKFVMEDWGIEVPKQRI